MNYEVNSVGILSAPIPLRFLKSSLVVFAITFGMSLQSAQAHVICSKGGFTKEPSNSVQFFVDMDEKSCTEGGYPGEGNGILFTLASGNSSGNPDVFKVRMVLYMCGEVFNKKIRGRVVNLVPPSGDSQKVIDPNTFWGGATYWGAVPGPTTAVPGSTTEANSSTLTVSPTVYNSLYNTKSASDPIKYTFTVDELSKPLGDHQISYGEVTIEGGRFDNTDVPAPVCDTN